MDFFYIPTALDDILGNEFVELEFQKKYMKTVFIYTPFSSFLHIFVVFNWLNHNRNSDFIWSKVLFKHCLTRIIKFHFHSYAILFVICKIILFVNLPMFYSRNTLIPDIKLSWDWLKIDSIDQFSVKHHSICRGSNQEYLWLNAKVS